MWGTLEWRLLRRGEASAGTSARAIEEADARRQARR
jgi:hypothetical protein